jgi:hypothetical protein
MGGYTSRIDLSNSPSKFKTMIYINVSLPGEGGGYIATPDEAKELIDALVENAQDHGDFEQSYEVKAVELTEEEFKNLPEFKGF